MIIVEEMETEKGSLMDEEGGDQRHFSLICELAVEHTSAYQEVMRKIYTKFCVT